MVHLQRSLDPRRGDERALAVPFDEADDEPVLGALDPRQERGDAAPGQRRRNLIGERAVAQQPPVGCRKP